MVVLGSDNTVLAFDENDVLEWFFDFKHEGKATATLLFKVGHKRALTDADALQLYDIFSAMYMQPEDTNGESEGSNAVLSDLL